MTHAIRGYVSRGLLIDDSNKCIIVEKFDTDREIANILVLKELRTLELHKFTIGDNKPKQKLYHIFSCDATNSDNIITQLTTNIQWSKYVVELSLIKRV